MTVASLVSSIGAGLWSLLCVSVLIPLNGNEISSSESGYSPGIILFQNNGETDPIVVTTIKDVLCCFVQWILNITLTQHHVIWMMSCFPNSLKFDMKRHIRKLWLKLHRFYENRVTWDTLLYHRKHRPNK